MCFAFLFFFFDTLPFCTVIFLCVLLCLSLFRRNCETSCDSRQKKKEKINRLDHSLPFGKKFKKSTREKGQVTSAPAAYKADHLKFVTAQLISHTALAGARVSVGQNGGEMPGTVSAPANLLIPPQR